MDAKKISFSFSKINKKTSLITNKVTSKTEKKVELIKCLEGQEIRLVEEKPDEKPLVIPLKENQKTSIALASLMKRRAVLLGEEEPDNTTDEQIEEKNNFNNVDINEDLEKRAARELLAELQTNGYTDAASTLVLPVVKPDDLPLEGAKESCLDDYENIPIEDFGKAMLRGMGWKEPPKTNKKRGPSTNETIMVRPKGMGLGADKALNKKPLLVAPEANEVLEVKRNAYVRILGGKHKDLYGQIEGFDDHAGRVIVKMAIGGNKEAFNEFLCQPISRKEFAQYGKCINTSKYEEYKKKENDYGQIILNQDEKVTIEKSYRSKEEKKIKKKRVVSPENDYKHQKRSDERNDKKYIKTESDLDRDYDYNRDKETAWSRNKEKYKSRNDNRCGRERERSRDREYRKNYRNDNSKNDYNDNKRYESRTDYCRDLERDSQRDYDYREYKRSSNKNRQQERDKNSRVERNENCVAKVIEVVDSSSESQSDTHTPKHGKSKKTKQSKKKSHKSKNNKSKYQSESSETQSSSSDTESTSSSSEEERSRKLRKKTKKSKKQRERSRSRDKR